MVLERRIGRETSTKGVLALVPGGNVRWKI